MRFFDTNWLKDRHYTAHTLLLSAFQASGGMTHFMQCFDQVVAFYCENYAAKSAEKQKRDGAAKVQQTDSTPLQFHMEPMEIDQNTPSSSSTTTTTTTTTTSQANRAFEEELAAVETTLQWYSSV
jgi:hypothetical protein